MSTSERRSEVRVEYAFVNGAHYFHSPTVKGLCAASRDLHAAYRAVAIQLSALIRDENGNPADFEPAEPVEQFEQRLVAARERAAARPVSGAVASWALMKNTKSTSKSS